MNRFKELEIWKRSRLYCSQIYSITSKFPESEKFGLTNQLRRAFNLKFISETEVILLNNELSEIIKMISKFKSTLKI